MSAPELGLFAVADGMGGHRAGEVASGLAIEAITAFISRSDEDEDVTWPYGIDEDLSIDGNRLRTAIFLANRKVFRAAESTDDYGGMGTTVVAVLVHGDRAAIGSVGDSRLYVFANGVLEQLTQDDTWAATILAQDPDMRMDDIANHPMRNVLTNVLGGRPTVDVRMAERELHGGETLVLCSDGVHGVLDEARITALLQSHDDVTAAAQAIIDAALEQGSRDNVTALVVRYEAGSEQ